MVFNEVESISDLLSGHRVIIYYIEDDSGNQQELHRYVESAMKMLEKKNDDLIAFKIRQGTTQFTQFKELYRPEIKGPISLFAVNAEGIPLINEDVVNEETLCQAFDSICSCCKLNAVSKSEMTKFFRFDQTYVHASNGTDNKLTFSSQTPNESSSFENKIPLVDSSTTRIRKRDEYIGSTLTELQIRLPDGSKDKQSFEKDACLQEVYNFINVKYNMTNFDLKTYHHAVFSSEDYGKSLQALDLTPNGVVMVVDKNVAQFNGNGSVSRLFQYALSIVFGKITPMLLYVKDFLLGYWNTYFSRNNRTSRRINNEGGSSNFSGKSSGSKRSTSNFGNIHTLRRSEESDDENNRYNGNSTQQK
ncbi:UBX domain-containing protein 4-like [Macrosteles quadrilineatus]|uniref:UBX domain-containing protein 4-like n=1 Tax=Macrosteles quadrilineatus TaxID=74068 RepID=UPI0023E1EBF7|nr:UBX domain-containing protein 4-like [Macrosteles quadrilineatus]